MMLIARCRLCHQLVQAHEPYCRSCGESRIGESLAAAPDEPEWLDSTILIGLLALVLAFAITLCVAFLREAQALRWSRSAAEMGEYGNAQKIITPFVAANPQSEEGLFIAGSVAFAQGRNDDAFEFYQRLLGLGEDNRQVQREGDLKDVFEKHMIYQASIQECGRAGYSHLYSTYRRFGAGFQEALLRGAAALARRCVQSTSPQVANEPGHWLVYEEKIDPRLVAETVYLDPAKQALSVGQHHLAKVLALQGLEFDSEIADDVSSVFQEKRLVFSDFVRSMRDLCRDLVDAPAYRNNSSICFPSSSPKELTDFQAEEGYIATYLPLLPNRREKTCFRGFRLISSAPDPLLMVDYVSKGDAVTLNMRYYAGDRACTVEYVDPFWTPEADE